jgi:hypothetical protein
MRQAPKNELSFIYLKDLDDIDDETEINFLESMKKDNYEGS